MKKEDILVITVAGITGLAILIGIAKAKPPEVPAKGDITKVEFESVGS
jgi:hypothetical protein